MRKISCLLFSILLIGMCSLLYSEQFEIHVGNDVYVGEIPNDKDELKKLVLLLAKRYNSINDSYLKTKDDAVDTINNVSNTQTQASGNLDAAITKLDSLENKTNEVKTINDSNIDTANSINNTVTNAPLPKPKFIALGLFLGCNSNFTPMNAGVSIGPVANFNLFDTALLGVGAGINVNSDLSLKFTAFITLQLWAF